MSAKIRIHPAPAVVVRADKTIGDCVRLMRNRKVGSVLVVSSDFREELVGIFTERDLLNKIDLIEHGRYWSRPISQAMTKPVRSIHIDDLESAADTMLKYGIRHLPVVAHDEKSRLRVAGVISMRDLFKRFIDAQKSTKKRVPVSKPLEVGLYSEDEMFTHSVRRAFEIAPSVRIRQLTLTFDTKKVKTVILDIDDVPVERWTRWIGALNRSASAPNLIIIFDPERHAPNTVESLKKLAQAKAFTVFEKPLPIGVLVEKIVG